MIILILPLMYLSLAAAFSFALLGCLPRRAQPGLRPPKGAEQAAVGGVVAGSILSAWHTASELAASFGISVSEAGLQVLYGTSQGLGVFGSLLFGALWYGIDAMAPESRAKRVLFLCAAAGLVVSAAASMHAATLSASALLAQALHLFAVSAWLGVLLLVGWFAPSGASWAAFYRWYSPMAAGCVAAVTASGFVLMSAMSTEWVNAWTLDYGQVLLVKHLLFLPLLVIASVNALLIAPKAKGKGTSGKAFDPRGWMRAESALSFLIFVVTAVLSRTSPPHDVAQTLRYTPPSDWFLFWYERPVTSGIELVLRAQPMSLLLGVIAVMFVSVVYLAYYRKAHPSLAVAASLLFAAAGYASLMLAVQ